MSVAAKPITGNHRVYSITMHVSHELDTDALAKMKARPVILPDGELDEQAIADLQSAAIEAELKLEEEGLELLDDFGDDYGISGSCTCGKSEPNTQDAISPSIILNVCYDPPRLTDEQRRQIDRMPFSETSHVTVKWKARRIKVNGSVFREYDDAIEEIVRLAKDHLKSIDRLKGAKDE